MNYGMCRILTLPFYGSNVKIINPIQIFATAVHMQGARQVDMMGSLSLVTVEGCS